MAPHFLFIHGAWHQPHHYDTLVKALKTRGYLVSIPLLPSCSSDTNQYSFADDVQVVRAELTALTSDQGRDVVVVVHSYGGTVAAEALHGFEKKGNAPGVVGLAWFAAFLLQKEQCLFDCLEGYRPPWVTMKEDEKLGIPIMYVEEDVAVETFYNNCTLKEARAAAGSIVEQPLSAQATKISGLPAYANWTIPMIYFLCENDLTLFPKFQKTMLANTQQNMGLKIEVVTLLTDHSPNMSMTEEFADKLDDFAKSV